MKYDRDLLDSVGDKATSVEVLNSLPKTGGDQVDPLYRDLHNFSSYAALFTQLSCSLTAADLHPTGPSRYI